MYQARVGDEEVIPEIIGSGVDAELSALPWRRASSGVGQGRRSKPRLRCPQSRCPAPQFRFGTGRRPGGCIENPKRL